jgi:hypothetical protein
MSHRRVAPDRHRPRRRARRRRRPAPRPGPAISARANVSAAANVGPTLGVAAEMVCLLISRSVATSATRRRGRGCCGCSSGACHRSATSSPTFERPRARTTRGLEHQHAGGPNVREAPWWWPRRQAGGDHPLRRPTASASGRARLAWFLVLVREHRPGGRTFSAGPPVARRGSVTEFLHLSGRPRLADL